MNDKLPLTAERLARRLTMDQTPEAVFFDAGFTLIEPRRPVFDVYYEEAEKLDAAPADRDAFRELFRSSWKSLNRDYRATHPEGRTSAAIERDAWHRFTSDLARPFPELAARHAPWLASLVAWFDSPGAWRPMPGAVEVLQSLRSDGVRIAVLSNWHDALHRILEGSPLRPFVDAITTSVDVGYRKPNAALFERGLESFAVDAGRTVHVGDSYEEDILGAQGVRVATVWVNPRDAACEGPPPNLTIGSLENLLAP